MKKFLLSPVGAKQAMWMVFTVSVCMGMFSIWLASCSAEKKAAMAAAKEAAGKKKELDQLQQVRDRLPVVITRTVQGPTTFVPGPVIACPPQTPGKTDSVHCPPLQIRHDTAYQEDKLITQQYKDSLSLLRYQFGQYKKSTDKQIQDLTHSNTEMQVKAGYWDTVLKWAGIVAGILFAGGLVAAYMKFKSKIGI